MRAGDIWQHLIDAGMNGEVEDGAWWRSRIAFILDHGSLSRRILRAVDGDFSRARQHEVYGRLCQCLENGQMFE
jgi:hypothetical protein